MSDKKLILTVDYDMSEEEGDESIVNHYNGLRLIQFVGKEVNIVKFPTSGKKEDFFEELELVREFQKLLQTFGVEISDSSSIGDVEMYISDEEDDSDSDNNDDKINWIS